jgi:uncharacterized protein YecE (DUF72 family)
VALYVGTSGWSYPEWRGSFYPDRLPQSRFLEFYGEQLSACEVNATFYRAQSRAALQRWAAAVPPPFRFATKAHRRLTYRRKLAPDPEVSGFVREFTDSLAPLGERLGCVLLQVPEFIERDDAALVALLGTLPPGMPFACELLHDSWRAPEVEAALAERGGTACLREEEGAVPDALPPGPLAYVRLKGMRYGDAEREALRVLLVREGAQRDVYAFARHKDVPPDDPHTGVGLARWLAGAAAGGES